MSTISTDIAVIGAGSGGLSVAAGAVQLGARVVLFERDRMGGDCLNHGCVPSKALLAAGHAAHQARTSRRFGVDTAAVEVDFAAVHAHVQDVIAGIAPHDSVERFEGLGVQVIKAEARFVAPRSLEADGTRIDARRIVIATGSSPAVPPIPGLDQTPFLTNETLFGLTRCPEHLIIIGAGPIGMEMAQAHRRLGAAVTVLDGMRMLGKDDPEAVDIVRLKMLSEGIALHESCKVLEVAPSAAGVQVRVEDADGRTLELQGSHLLVAVGRTPNVSALNLDAAGIEHDRRGIKVDARLRTSNKKVYAIGDVTGGFQFTHVAGYHAGIVIRNALFRLPARARSDVIPWVTYTDPELAHVGLLESQARELHGSAVRVLRSSFEDNDRARAERAGPGQIKLVLGRRGRLLGATIVGARAGELLAPWVLALEKGLKLSDMAGTIVAYPTLAEIGKRVAGSYYTDRLFSSRTRCLVRFLLNFA
ncbi:MAG: FAD-dependent oxidoreductase [Gammaproteobacteria bacterium]|nr:FAD-dependent oxidoreductase [Gammaproteobacteria bacterium]